MGHHLSRGILILLFILVSTPFAWARVNVTVIGSDPDKMVLKGDVVTPEGNITGEVVIEGDSIVCVAVDCPDPVGATIISVSEAFIYPGFIDAHNHVAYNAFPKWTPPRLYENRGQWQRSAEYKAFKAPYNDLKGHVLCELVKYDEIKALLSGVTTIEGTAPNNLCFRTLIRNAENQNELGLPSNHIRTFILDVNSFKSTIDWTKTHAFVIHLSEGIDEKSRAEFDTLKAKRLLQPATVIIHGTAFGEGEFQEMGTAGAKLVWSRPVIPSLPH